MKKQIRLIVNPASGLRKKRFLEQELSPVLKHPGFSCELFYTKGPTHATDLAQEAVDLHYYAVVVCGGDGTINEVLAPLLHSSTALGVIPLGSGNGFARHLGISMLPAKAAKQLTQAQPVHIDACMVNNLPFVNVAGIGLDALVAHDFSIQPERGFWAYFSSVLRLWFKTSNRVYKLKLDGKKFKVKALMVSFANGSQFGNNAMIAPGARMDDGLMQVCFLRKFPTLKAPVLAWQLFSGKIIRSRHLRILPAREVSVKRTRKKIHLDGEPFKLSKKLRVKVLPAALNILAPSQYFEAHGPQHSLDRPG